MGDFDYRRRVTNPVNVGGVKLGGDYPIRIQSMTSTSTMDADGSVEQCKRLAEAGAEYVRLTAQGVREAANLDVIKSRLRACGCNVPLVADIHFNPKAAFEAARHVEKVRINPGNFIDPGRTFKKLDFTDEEYAAEIKKIESALVPFLDLCRENGTAIRIGVNHGSLSDRIMSRYGDTPQGMAESAMEFLRVCVAHDFNDVVISVKASNVSVMIETVRRLVAAMDAENMHFPLHLGVTEAGDGDDGRIKSAVGIGTLLAEGLGDTIRVSLSEDPVCEIPVAKMLVDYVATFASAPEIPYGLSEGFNRLTPRRRESDAVGIIGGTNRPVVLVEDGDGAYSGDEKPDAALADLKDYIEVDAALPYGEWPAMTPGKVVIMTSTSANYPASVQGALHKMISEGLTNPVILKASYAGVTPDEVTVRASVDLGAPLMNGFVDGIMIESDAMSAADAVKLAFGILQATRLRITRTDYIACPGCGRTLFDLQSTLKMVKSRTSHLKGLKIGVMGCIVNGPGEMADADYGYVGAGVGKVSLYKGKVCVEKNIPAGAEAVDRLLDLIKSDGNWK